jgi:hypothetical protein
MDFLQLSFISVANNYLSWFSLQLPDTLETGICEPDEGEDTGLYCIEKC